MIRRPPSSTLFPYTTFFPSWTMGYLAANVVTTTDYNYGSGVYLLNSAVARGKQADNFDATVKIRSKNRFVGKEGKFRGGPYSFKKKNLFIADWQMGYMEANV